MSSNYGPRVEWQQLQVGVRIYYTGDMANSDGFGVITAIHEPNRWKYQQVDIRMDDGREWRGTHLAGFQPAPGRRWWLESDWKADRQRRIEEMQRDWAENAARRRQA